MGLLLQSVNQEIYNIAICEWGNKGRNDSAAEPSCDQKKKKRKTALLLDCYDSADLRVFELLKGLWQKEMLCIAPDKPRLENYCTDA